MIDSWIGGAAHEIVWRGGGNRNVNWLTAPFV